MRDLLQDVVISWYFAIIFGSFFKNVVTLLYITFPDEETASKHYMKITIKL